MQFANLQKKGLDGVTHYWEAEIFDDSGGGVTIRQNALGKKPRGLRIPQSQCKDHDPGKEIAMQRELLLTKGWVDVNPPVETVEEANQRITEKYFGEPTDVWF